MKAAIVQQAGQPPVYADFAEPVPAQGENRITVSAAAISHLVKGRAAGTHYSATAQFPFVVGIDGIGQLEDGTRVYFLMPRAPHGSMAERTVVPAAQCVALPDDLDDITAAAIANPGMSSWAALTERAKLKPGETVLVNGATGGSGRLAVRIARHLGAAKIIATGRNAAALNALAALGADVTISLTDSGKPLEDSFKAQFAEGIDVIIDYLWGETAKSLLLVGAKAQPEAMPLRFVQVGAMSGPEIALPASILRSSAIELMGSGLGSVKPDRLINAIGALLRATVPGGFQIASKPAAFADFDQAWPLDDSNRRTVFTMRA